MSTSQHPDKLIVFTFTVLPWSCLHYVWKHWF